MEFFTNFIKVNLLSNPLFWAYSFLSFLIFRYQITLSYYLPWLEKAKNNYPELYVSSKTKILSKPTEIFFFSLKKFPLLTFLPNEEFLTFQEPNYVPLHFYQLMSYLLKLEISLAFFKAIRLILISLFFWFLKIKLKFNMENQNIVENVKKVVEYTPPAFLGNLISSVYLRQKSNKLMVDYARQRGTARVKVDNFINQSGLRDYQRPSLQKLKTTI